MKEINKDELYDNLHSFLKSKGVELREGGYQSGVKSACSLLADAVNLGQQGLERAKVEMDKRLEQMRQYIHEQTAPKPPPAAASQASAGPTAPKASKEPTASQARPKRAKPAPRRKPRKKATRR